MSPLLSIVIPTYKQAAYIEQCLQSIRVQTFADFEVVIQDSCSNDGTKEICERFSMDSRFKYFQEKDRGQSHALMLGLARCSGKYWTWICSDDFYTQPGALNSLIEQIVSEGPDVIGCFGNAELVSEEGRFIDNYPSFKQDVYQKTFKLNWPFSQPASILRRSAVIEVGGINVNLKLGMDLDLFIRLTKQGRRFKYVAANVASVRIQPQSKSVMLREETAKCALGIVKYYFGNVGFAPFSAYATELGFCRFEAFKQSVKKNKQKQVNTASKTIKPPRPKQTGIRYLFWGSYNIILRLTFKMIAKVRQIIFTPEYYAKYVFSYNSGKFYSYEILRKSVTNGPQVFLTSEGKF